MKTSNVKAVPKRRGPGKLHNREIALAFELQTAGVKPMWIARALSVTPSHLSRALEKAKERGLYLEKPPVFVRHTEEVNKLAYSIMVNNGHI